MAAPVVKVEVAFASTPDHPLQTWTDITEYVRYITPISMTRGRADEFANVEPGRLSLVLDNADGRFTYGYASGAYYPAVKPRKRIRVTVDGSPRFDGYVDAWPAEWAGGITQQPRVTVTATDRLARFGDLRTLRDPLAEELGTAAYVSGFTLDRSILDSADMLAGGTVWLYGLQESSGSTSAGDVSGAPGRPTLTVAQVGAGGSLEFGASGIMPEGTAAKFSPASAGNGRVLTDAAAQSYIGTEFSLWAQFAWTGDTGAQIAQIGTSPGSRVILSVTPSAVTVTFTSPDASTATATKTWATSDNAAHFALVSVTGTTISLYVDQESAATAMLPGEMGTAQGITIGGTTSADPLQAAWVGFANASTDATRAADLGGLATGVAERSDLRVSRILGWLDLAADAALETGLSNVAYQACGGRAALEVINEANAVEFGVFFPTGDGRFTQHSRDHRYNRAVAVNLDAADIDGDMRVSVDTARMVNDLQASRPRGATYRARNEASIADYGPAARTLTLYAASDSDLITATDWKVQRYGDVAPHVPAITADLLTREDIRAQVLGLEIGDRINVVSLPTATTPGGPTVDLFVEGFDEKVGARDWTVTIATSPAYRGDAFTLDDATFGLLDSTAVLVY